MINRTVLIAAGALFTLASLACGKGGSSGTTDIEYSSDAIEQSGGGVAEGDSSMAGMSSYDVEEASDDVEVDDEEKDDINTPSIGIDDSLRKRVALRILWGNILGESTPTASTNWSGKLKVDGGMKLKLIRTVRFDANDAITAESDTEIAWTSTTQPHLDGVMVVVRFTATGGGTLTFETGPLTKSFSATELVNLSTIVAVDANNAVSFRAIPVGPCPRGFVVGHWRRIDTKGGIFRGSWVNALGSHWGFVEGIWGQRASGEKVFFGRFVSKNGKIRGLVKGHYDAGLFRGVWMRRGAVRGVVRGHYADRNGDGRGFFGGEWIKYCAAYRRCEAEVNASTSVSEEANTVDATVDSSATADAAASTSCK